MKPIPHWSDLVKMYVFLALWGVLVWGVAS